jgi:PKD repeat protein
MIVGGVATMASVSPPVIPAPVANFSWSPADPTQGQLVSFTDQTANDPTGWEWKINGTLFSIEQNPTFYFTMASRYTITLTATNSAGSNTATG